MNRLFVVLLALPLVACSQPEPGSPEPAPPTNTRDAVSHVVIYVDGMT